MHGCKGRSCKLWGKEAEKKSRNSSTLVGQKTFSLKLYYNRCPVVLQQVSKIYQKSSGRSDSGTAWNSFIYRRFLASHVCSQPRQIFEQQGLRLKERAFLTPNSSCDPRRSSSCMIGVW
ncbi:hypothetical protein TNCV_1247971 [Trichonephila clavipes]|nr:hypothetical protein TNCV_1247971 [Trichonephila clavipes]